MSANGFTIKSYGQRYCGACGSTQGVSAAVVQKSVVVDQKRLFCPENVLTGGREFSMGTSGRQRSSSSVLLIPKKKEKFSTQNRVSLCNVMYYFHTLRSGVFWRLFLAPFCATILKPNLHLEKNAIFFGYTIYYCSLFTKLV